MKRLYVVFALLLMNVSLGTLTQAQTSNAKNVVAQARRNYATIERNLKNYTRIETDLMGESTEGGQLIAYYHDGTPRKIVARFYGETGRDTNEYYFWNGKLFFVLETSLRYDKPFGKVVGRTQNRFYFAGGKLVRWIDNNGKVRDGDRKWLQLHEAEKLGDARKYLAKANQLLD